MDRKVIKLEAAFGSERVPIVVNRKQDLVVMDVMEDVQKVMKIPINEQVIFHKGTNLCDFPTEKLENLGVENNHTIRVTRDSELPSRSPRAPMTRNYVVSGNGVSYPPIGGTSPTMMNVQGQGSGPFNSATSPRYANGYSGGLDPVSYLKEITPNRVSDPNPYQMQAYK